MGTVWVCSFPSCTTLLPCRVCNLSPSQHLLQPSTALSLPLTNFHARASQTTNTTRKTRKLKTDAEICNDIREFLASVGLPQDHIPSTKEILLHGWNDLANIVRRRGHKQIREILTRGSLNADIDSLNDETSLDERLDDLAGCEDSLTGQNEKVDSLLNDVSSSTGLFLGNSYSSSHVGLTTTGLDEGTYNTDEASADLSGEDGSDEVKDHVEEGNFYPTEMTVADGDCNSSREGLYPNFYSQSSMPIQISGELPAETTSSGNLKCKDSSVGKMVGEIMLPLAVPSTENHLNMSFHDSITSANLALKEKAANFIQNGDLDQVEDDSLESREYTESEAAMDMPLGNHPPEDNNVTALKGNSLTSEQVVPAGSLDQPFWNDHVPHEDLTTHFNKDMDTEAPTMQNESEINRLKFMLHQKELELSQLKEQIEKEKLALSVLQTKAEVEISKAKKLVYEKDAELDVAEESLSGLKEVQIEFCGDGDVVEVAGSFNGWHQRIKMDPQPSTSASDPSGPRRSRLWSAMLWLYPGVYEIKFVIDGQWTTDPQRESVSRGHICNNILRVDR
ncbi:hypothetical protein RJT34_00342 [Clitoria ternatea]|uniref:AMP-activated protein kinase glycogen-binding domain-containing protein n=1 Tax=Clitoria ternatea TaxID=43366 RepID=A0AAN9KHV1_CLITE